MEIKKIKIKGQARRRLSLINREWRERERREGKVGDGRKKHRGRSDGGQREEKEARMGGESWV